MYCRQLQVEFYITCKVTIGMRGNENYQVFIYTQCLADRQRLVLYIHYSASKRQNITDLVPAGNSCESHHHYLAGKQF